MDNNTTQKVVYTHEELLKWVIENKPEEGSPAKFYSYEFLFYSALNLRENPGETLSAQDIEAVVHRDFEQIYEDLWQDHDIAVQMSAVESWRTGVRIMNLL